MAIEIVSFRRFSKNTLQGFVVVRLTNVGIEIHDLCLHEKNGQRWLALPAKSYEKEGKTSWIRIIDFYDRARWDQFQRNALAAFDAFIAQEGGDGDQ